MSVILIAAVSKNGVIGNNGDLIYKDPEDLKHFKEVTMGHAVYMGRKTYESIPGDLKGRNCFVFTRGEKPPYSNKFLTVSDYITYTSNFENKFPDIYKKRREFIIGGGEIYRQLMPLADELIISEFNTIEEGDTYFPKIDLDMFVLKYIKPFKNFSLKVYHRKNG